MSASESTLYSVWTQTDQADWVEHNAGCSDVPLAAGLPKADAEAIAGRIRYVYRDQRVKVHPSDWRPARS